MRKSILFATVAILALFLSGCDETPGPIMNPAQKPVLIFTDENGVKVYGFVYGGHVRCYAVGGAMCSFSVDTAKPSVHKTPDVEQVVIPPPKAKPVWSEDDEKALRLMLRKREALVKP